jgi:hypothetical protein
MSIATLGELKAALPSWAFDRADLAALLDDFVRSAHDRIVEELLICEEVAIAASPVAYPDDFREISQFWLRRSPMVLLEEISAEQLADAGAGCSGVPRFYADNGTGFDLWPTPDQAYTGRIVYRISRDFFASDLATNIALTRRPFVYLWATLAEIGAFLADAEMAAGHEAKYQAELKRANEAAVRQATAGGTLQTAPSGAVV